MGVCRDCRRWFIARGAIEVVSYVVYVSAKGGNGSTISHGPIGIIRPLFIR